MADFSHLTLVVVSAFPSQILQQPGVTPKWERLWWIRQSRVLNLISHCSSLCTMLTIEHHKCTTWDVSNLTSLQCIPFSIQTSLSMLFWPLFPSSVAISSINNCESTLITPRVNFLIGFSFSPIEFLSMRSWYASIICLTTLSWTHPPQPCSKIQQRRVLPKTTQTSFSKWLQMFGSTCCKIQSFVLPEPTMYW